MKRFIGPLTLLALAMILHKDGHAQNSYPVDDSGRSGGAPLGAWLGGPNSLPIGNGSPHEAISRALSMAAVRPIMDEFQHRGYVRMPDGDVAFLQPNFTTVAIVYRKPGWAPTVRTPVILVASRKEGSYFVTQAYGGLVGGDDPNAPMRVYDEWPDRGVVVAGRRVAAGSGRGTLRPEAGQTPGEFGGFVTAYDPSAFGPMMYAQWDYTLYEDTGYGAHVWGQYATLVGASTMVGALNGFRAPIDSWPGTVTWGAVAGWYLSNTTFWATHDRGF